MASFIESVKNRLEQAQAFGKFKNLLMAYQISQKAKVFMPKVYGVISYEDIKEYDWQEARKRLPNIYVVRPSVYLNSSFDYFIRDDGVFGLHNIRDGATIPFESMVKEQIENLVKLSKSTSPVPSIILEEFPITNGLIQYPVSYMVHCFYGEVAVVQINTGDSDGLILWVEPDARECMSSKTKGTSDDFKQYLPTSEDDWKDLIEAASRIGGAAGIPYIRADFVLSTRGPIFRSFACIPADVRSRAYNWYYGGKVDEDFGNKWLEAEERIQHDRAAFAIPAGETDEDSVYDDDPVDDNA